MAVQHMTIQFPILEAQVRSLERVLAERTASSRTERPPRGCSSTSLADPAPEAPWLVQDVIADELGDPLAVPPQLPFLTDRDVAALAAVSWGHSCTSREAMIARLAEACDGSDTG